MAGRRRLISKIANTTLSVIVGVVVSEVFLRYYFDVITYRRTAAVEHIQQYLELRPDIGFAWHPNISYDEGIALTWADQDRELSILCTDQWGFRNHPRACADARAGRGVDIVGVGDSFIEMGARPFYEYFADRSLRYHSFAMHRQCTPQYNIILKKYALPLRPRFVLYGVFENDFYELADYEAWLGSGMDWFAYHSGYWCGPPYTENQLWRPRGYRALYRAVLPASFAERRLQGIVGHALDRACSDILEAHQMCSAAHARLLVLLIPGRETLFHGLKRVAECYDHISAKMGKQGVAVMDLQPVIQAYPHPQELYYRRDGHWNLKGMRLAVNAVYARLLEMRSTSQPALAHRPMK